MIKNNFGESNRNTIALMESNFIFRFKKSLNFYDRILSMTILPLKLISHLKPSNHCFYGKTIFGLINSIEAKDKELSQELSRLAFFNLIAERLCLCLLTMKANCLLLQRHRSYMQSPFNCKIDNKSCKHPHPQKHAKIFAWSIVVRFVQIYEILRLKKIL